MVSAYPGGKNHKTYDKKILLTLLVKEKHPDEICMSDHGNWTTEIFGPRVISQKEIQWNCNV